MRGEKGLRETRGGNRSPVSTSGYLRRQGSRTARPRVRAQASKNALQDSWFSTIECREIEVDEECGLGDEAGGWFLPG